MTVDLDQNLRLSKSRVTGGESGRENRVLPEEVHRFEPWAKGQLTLDQSSPIQLSIGLVASKYCEEIAYVSHEARI